MAKYDAMGDKIQRRVPIAVWIMLIGLVVGITGLIWCLNTDLKKYTKTENLCTDQTTDNVKNLDFEFDNAKVKIAASSDDQIHVNIEDAAEGVYSYGEKDGKFYIHRKRSFGILKFSGMSSIPFLKDVYPQAKITVEIPSGISLDKVELDCAMSDITAEGIKCEKLDIDNGMGSLKLRDIEAEKTVIDNGMGKIDAKDCTFGNTDIDNGMGSIDMNGCVLEDTDIDNGMGSVDISIDRDGEDYRVSGDADVKGKTGSKNADYKIKVDNGMGSVDIRFR